METRQKPPVAKKSDFLRTLRFRSSARQSSDRQQRSLAPKPVTRCHSNLGDYDRSGLVARYLHSNRDSRGELPGVTDGRVRFPSAEADPQVGDTRAGGCRPQPRCDSKELGSRPKRGTGCLEPTATDAHTGGLLSDTNTPHMFDQSRAAFGLPQTSKHEHSDRLTPGLTPSTPPALRKQDSITAKDFQEGLKSILFWHVIGSYQNLNKLADSEKLASKNDAASDDLELRSLQVGSSSLCGEENLTFTGDLEFHSLQPESRSYGSDIQFAQRTDDRTAMDTSQTGREYCSCTDPDGNPDRGVDQVCPRCRKSVYALSYQDHQKVKSFTSPQRQRHDQSGASHAACDLYIGYQEGGFQGDALASNRGLLQRYTSSSKLQQLEKALIYLRGSSVDDDTKQRMLSELDCALDYLIAMVTDPSTNEMPGRESRDDDGDDDDVFLGAQPGTVMACEAGGALDSYETEHDSCVPPSMRPKSFLHDEMNEFDRIFSELFFSPHKRMSVLASDLIKHDSHNKSPGPGSPVISRNNAAAAHSNAVNAEEIHGRSEGVSGVSGPARDKAKIGVHIGKSRSLETPAGAHVGDLNDSVSGAVKCEQCGYNCDPNCAVYLKSILDEPVKLRRKPAGGVSVMEKRSASLESPGCQTQTSGVVPDFSIPAVRTKYIHDSLKKLKNNVCDDSDKLFSDLLDDLDNITKLNTDSARRRKKARDIFSDWLFHSDDSLSPPPGGSRRSSDHKRRSADLNNIDFNPQLFNRWRPPAFEYANEDDTDSGYHTGDGSLGEEARRYRGLVLPPKPPGEYTLTREDLRNRIEAFNNNNQGLIMSLHQESNTFQGFIRVHINLIRPINMSLAVRPPSLYEVLTHEEEHPPQTPPTPTDGDTQIASFYLPKDTTKVIHISSDTTTQEVIKLLLSKFKITDNPRKFALYEKLEHENVMRKMSADEQPLPLCLTWGSDGLTTHKFVLQENDSGDVIWEAFSVPELRNFLAILNKEEEEYVDQIKAKYSLMQIHITRRMQEIQKEIQKGRAKSALSSALTQKMSQTSVSAPETPERQSDSKHRLGVGKVRKSDVHKDTPRPFEIPSPGQGQVGEGQRGDLDVDRLQGQLQANQHRPAKEKSPPSVAFGEDEREGVFV